jgi:hypothetical protein
MQLQNKNKELLDMMEKLEQDKINGTKEGNQESFEI